KNSVPDKFLWNGINSEGRPVADGLYSSFLTIVYKKGNVPTALSRKFVIDTIYPEVSSEAEYILFSPNSDGLKDNLEITQTSSFEDIWHGEISSGKGHIVKSFLWKEQTENMKWDATDDEGNRVPDGKYNYIIYSIDAAGNRSSSEIRDIVIDTEPTTIFLTASGDYLSPTGSNLYDDITFSTIINNKSGLESWSVKIIHESGNVEKIFQGNEGIPKNITWNGVNESEKIVEGNYTALFSAVYFKGNAPEVRSSEFLLDISSPVGSVSLTPVPFSPDNDGLNDDISIRINVNDVSDIKKWDLKIYDPENRPFITYSGEGNPTEKIIWDGRSSNGELVYAAMDYPLKLTLEDKLGNISSITKKIPVDVLVVREGDILKIKIANIIFKKNSHELLADSPEVI
ncbi:MAG: flagellar motor protein MotB, partial [Spirochaetales bacterium]|nr:flagellar motor protein MotB [Spirochaetales bacterium]